MVRSWPHSVWRVFSTVHVNDLIIHLLITHALFCFLIRKPASSNWGTQRRSAATETTGVWRWRSGRRVLLFLANINSILSDYTSVSVFILFYLIVNVSFPGLVCTGVSSHMDDEYKWAGVEDPKVMVTTSRDPSSRLKMFSKVRPVSLVRSGQQMHPECVMIPHHLELLVLVSLSGAVKLKLQATFLSPWWNVYVRVAG